jgi:Domain of unknown function (DUF5655)
MTGEMVFTVKGAVATVAEPISLADAGLLERQHLQEWVLTNPKVIGEDVKLVTFEFGRWSAASGAVSRDRLDVLGLDRDGRLVVVELKRDQAPDTVDMQALKYAALVSRFTIDDLAKVHAKYLSERQREVVSPEQAVADLEDWATLAEESLRLPRIVLMATEFPMTATATIVFLHQQLGLDVRLLRFQAYRTTSEVLVTVSQLYPPPDVEEFVLSPEVNEQRMVRTERQRRQRETSTVSRLLEAGALEPGDRLEFRAPSPDLHSLLEPWLEAVPARRYAAWQDDATTPLIWEADGAGYSPTGLAARILEEGADRTGAIQGPLFWIADDGRSLVEVARSLPSGGEIDLADHLVRLSAELRPVFDALEKLLLGLGPDMSEHSRIKSIKFYRLRKLCDVSPHAEHISVYILGVSDSHDADELVVSRHAKYVHAQVRTVDEVERLGPVLKYAYELQAS